MQKSYDIPLHDIKPIVEVQEYSLYYFWAAALLIFILFFAAAYLIYMWLKKRNAYNMRKEHFKLLSSLDLSDTKKSAYALTLYGATFKDDGQRHSEMYKNLTDRLDKYKYKKEVDSFDKEVIGYIELYRDTIDV